jgi:site-specific recombinase XerD
MPFRPGDYKQSHSYTVADLDLVISDNTLKGHLDIFLLSCQVDGLSPATIIYYRKQVGYFLVFLTGVKHPSEVTVNHVRVYILSLQARGISPFSVSAAYRAVKRFFSFLVNEHTVTVSPFASMKPPKVPEKVIQPFTVDHLKKMFRVLEVDGSYCAVRNRAILLIFLDTGLRLAELTGIQLADIAIQAGRVKVNGKGSKERIVHLGEQAHKALLSYLLARRDRFHDSLPCLWLTEEGIELGMWGIVSMIRKLKKRADIKGVRCSPHTFRHTCAVFYLKNGGDSGTLQTMLGHEDSQMTRHYAKTALNDQMIQVHQKASPGDNLFRK